MTNLNQFDPSTLVLKMVGGPLDGKLLPISTQKCFLTGGENQNDNQCAIIRGPSGTAIKSTGDQILVNDHADHLHWLHQGDTICVGDTTMIVQQLGCYGQATVQTVTPTPEAVVDNAISTDSVAMDSDESVTNGQDEKLPEPEHTLQPQEPAMESPLTPEPATPANIHTDNPELPTGTMKQVNDILERLELAQHEPELVASEPITGETQTSTPEAPVATQDSAQSELQAFLANAGTQAAPEQAPAADASEVAMPASESEPVPGSDPDTPSDSAPVETHQEEPTQEEKERLNNALLERALKSLEQVKEEPPQPQPEPVSDMAQELSEIQDQLQKRMQAESEAAQQADEAHEPNISEPVSETPVSEPQDDSSEMPKLPNLSEILGRAAEEPADEEETNDFTHSEPAAPALEQTTDSNPTPPTQVEEAMTTQLDEAPAETGASALPQGNSVADVLARMKSAGQFTDYNLPTDEAGEPEAAPMAAPVTNPVVQAPEPQLEPESTDDGAESSVQDYMNQLFQRLRGTDAPEPAAKEEPKQEPEVPAEPAAREPQDSQEIAPVLSAQEYVPKQQAPEVKSDLEAMRQLANKQKQAAVQICTSKKSQLDQAFNQCIGVSSLVAAVVLGWMSPSLGDPLFKAAFGCLCIAFIAGFRYFTLIRKEKNAVLDGSNGNQPASPKTTDEQPAATAE